MLLLLTFISAITFAFLYQWNRCKKLPKGPTPLPLIGNLHQLSYAIWKQGGILDGYRVFEEKYGKVYTLWIGPMPTVYINDYTVAHETHVKRANQFGVRYSAGVMDYLREGQGIISSNGEFWQQHRRFALQTLRNFGLGRNIMEQRIMEELNYRMFDLEKRCNNNSGALEFSAPTLFDLLVGSIINQLLMSKRFEHDDPEYYELKENLDKSISYFDIFDMFIPARIMKSKWLEWRQGRILRPLDAIHDYGKRQIEKRVAEIESGEHVLEENANDFLDAFLYKMKADKENGIESTFSHESLAVDMYDLWIAGHDTTATTLKWGFLCLLHHPEVEEKLRQELFKVTANGSRPLTQSDKQDTPYLMAVINEVQRIASILNINLFRYMEEDTHIEGEPVSAGTIVTAQMGLIHTDERLFPNHTKFDPSRYLDDSSLEKKLIPFGIGKRACLGESLARAELYLILGNLVLRYKLSKIGQLPPYESITPFGIMKRPPSYNMRLEPIH